MQRIVNEALCIGNAVANLSHIVVPQNVPRPGFAKSRLIAEHVVAEGFGRFASDLLVGRAEISCEQQIGEPRKPTFLRDVCLSDLLVDGAQPILD